MPNKTVLIFGDVIGRLGREALAKALPDFCLRYSPDLVIANGENLAHGFGITPKIIRELAEAGVDVFTSGNHIWSNPTYKDVLSDPELNRKVIRPLNDKNQEGLGYTIVEKGGSRYLVVNLTGITFMDPECSSPFHAIDQLLEDMKDERFDAIVVDFHAEATSEKNVLGLYLDGRVSIFYGTHTHIPTADERILPQGTAYISDVGMTGAHNQALGGRYDLIVEDMKDGGMGKFDIPTEGPVEINALLVKVDPKSGKASSVGRIRKVVDGI
ncbi:MAG: TIGR00282 family metallophosphoesterase [Candidatus Uhrbacteria bacterium]|nr:YmdB family metallophosphoesterase [Patescibacteria group bacterium]MBU1906873.1 YmdB family metallophosphoesterase [Patescibacteria group bacterium]